MVERDGAVAVDSGDGLGYDLGPFGGWKIVRFEDKAFEPSVEKLLGEVEIVDAPFDDVRSNVDL